MLLKPANNKKDSFDWYQSQKKEFNKFYLNALCYAMIDKQEQTYTRDFYKSFSNLMVKIYIKSNGKINFPLLIEFFLNNINNKIVTLTILENTDIEILSNVFLFNKIDYFK